MATALYLVLERETGEVRFASAGHPPPLVLGPDGAAFLEGGRSVRWGAVDPGVFREAAADAARGRLAAALHRRAGRAARRAARAAPRRPGRGGRPRRGRARGALRRRPRRRASARACPATTWRCWRCARAGGERVDPLHAARRARVAAGPAPPAGALPPRGRRRRRRDLRDHAHGLGGGRQRDRARLRTRRRDLRRRGEPGCRRARGDRERPGTLEGAARRPPRPRAEHHRGPDGPGRGVDRARRAPWCG